MTRNKIIGSSIPNIPWEEQPTGNTAAVWRSARNPIIPRNFIPRADRIYNSAAVPFQGGFAGVFRVDDRMKIYRLHAGFSPDGIHWKIDHDPMTLHSDNPDLEKYDSGYDPRVVWIDDRYYVTWCNRFHGPTIGMAYTFDFQKFHFIENAFLPFNRNGVLFPRRINGHYGMLSRPSDNSHTPFGDIFYSRSPDMIHWGAHRWVMGPVRGWQSTKVGPGPIPIETSEGWLMIYHGVQGTCNGFVYSMGVALLDLDKPWKVIARGAQYLLGPEEIYEVAGHVSNVCFPCAALADAGTGRIAVYYGAADTVVGLAYTTLDRLLNFLNG